MFMQFPYLGNLGAGRFKLDIRPICWAEWALMGANWIRILLNVVRFSGTLAAFDGGMATQECSKCD